MHRHDLNTIAALADGSLKDETTARALVESCDECRIEYESHRVVIAALAAVEPATMTDLEKAALHRDLWTDLRADAAPAVKTPPWWYRWSYAAAGVFVVVGLVGVVSQLGGVSTSDSAAPAALEPHADGTDDLAVLEADKGEADELGAAETTIASAEDVASAEDAGTAEDAGDGTETPSRSLDVATFSLLVEQARSIEPTSSEAAATYSSDETARRAADCVQDAGLSAQEVIGEVDVSTMYLLTVAIGEEIDADTVFTVVDFETCKVLSVEG